MKKTERQKPALNGPGFCHVLSELAFVVHSWFCVQENEGQDGSSVGVVLCGHKDMTEKLSKQMQASGVSKEKILLNFG